MNDFFIRLKNVAVNVRTKDIDRDREAMGSQNADDIEAIAVDIQNERPGITNDEYDTIQALSAIATKFGNEQDGQDRDFVEHLQAAQKILMCRGGSRTWQSIHEQRAV